MNSSDIKAKCLARHNLLIQGFPRPKLHDSVPHAVEPLAAYCAGTTAVGALEYHTNCAKQILDRFADSQCVPEQFQVNSHKPIIPNHMNHTYHSFFRGQSTFVHLSLADMSSLWRTRVICMGLLLTTSSCPTSNTLEIPPWIYGCWIHLLAFIKFKTIIKDIKNDWRTLKVSKVCDSPHSSMDTNFTTRFASSICHLPGLWSRRFSIGFHKVLQPPSHLALRSRLLQML